jgi:hypothetical protein
MSEAVGIHDHPTKKLGRRPAKNAPALKFGAHLRATPAHPITDVEDMNISWPMDLNDRFGVCVVADGRDHVLQAINHALGVPYTNMTDAQIIVDYQTQNPDFDPSSDVGDGGMDIQTYLEYLQKKGVIVAFAKVDHTNADEMKAAAYLFLAVVTGEVLEQAQQSGKVWDDVSGSPDWGGHCTTNVGYLGSPDQDQHVSWGDVYDLTRRFVNNRVEEAWVVLTDELIAHPSFRQNYDLASLAQAYVELTGRPFPVVVPPEPPPPSPNPPPGPSPAPGPDYPPAPAPAPGGTLRQWLSAVLHWAYNVWHIFRGR